MERKKENNSFEYSQTLKNHKANVTSLIQLRDGTFASSSADHTIIIWKEIKNENNNFIEYEMAYTVTDYPHGIYKLIQLEDNRLCGTSLIIKLSFGEIGQSFINSMENILFKFGLNYILKIKIYLSNNLVFILFDIKFI